MNSHAIKSGVMLSVISIVLTLLFYLVDPTLLAKWWLGIGIFVIMLVLVVYFGSQHRKDIGGFMTFGQGWVYSFQLFVVAGLIGTIFNILLYNVIDPELPEIVGEEILAAQEAMMSNFGMPEDQLEEALEKAREDAYDRFTISGSLIGFLWGLIVYAILSLITGAIIKKKEPELE